MDPNRSTRFLYKQGSAGHHTQHHTPNALSGVLLTGNDEHHGCSRLDPISISGGASQGQIFHGNRPLEQGYSIPPLSSSVEQGVRASQHPVPTFTDTPRHHPLRPDATASVAGSPESHFATPADLMMSSQASDTSTIRPQSWPQSTAHPREAASPPAPTGELRQAIATIEKAALQTQDSQQRLATLVSQKTQVLNHYKATTDKLVQMNSQLQLEQAGHGSNDTAVIAVLLEQQKELMRHQKWLGNKFETLEYDIEEAHRDVRLGT